MARKAPQIPRQEVSSAMARLYRQRRAACRHDHA
jgi:hypothetical protein